MSVSVKNCSVAIGRPIQRDAVARRYPGIRFERLRVRGSGHDFDFRYWSMLAAGGRYSSASGAGGGIDVSC